MEVDTSDTIVDEDQPVKEDIVIQEKDNDIESETKLDLNNLDRTVLKEEDMDFKVNYEESESEDEIQSSGSDFEDELKPKNLKCNHCDKEFVSEISLKVHRNKEHPGKKRGPQRYHQSEESVDHGNP